MHPSVVVIVGAALFLGGCATQRNPVSVNNPFLLNDPSGFQLQTWALTHPNGGNLRTTDGSGVPLPSNTASLQISDQGPERLVLDTVLLNKLASFNRERIPERVVHARGHGAFGRFLVTRDVSQYTKAKVFNGLGKVTPILVRFSSTIGNAGGSETFRDPKGFAIKFYTEDGNLDFPGLKIDVFNVPGPMIFPDINRSLKRNPQTHQIDLTMFHDFLSQRPAATHHYLKSYSDAALVGSSRSMDGYGINVYECVNAQGDVVYCKFSWQPWQNIAPLTDAEAITLAGTQPDYYTKDLYNAIASGNFPKWTLGLQVLTFAAAANLSFNPFNPTMLWRTDQFPVIPIGVFVLDTNPTDFFAQIEQAAFCPNFVPGLRASPDRMLMARSFAYKDAQRYRLGPNFEQIEVNRPLSRVDGYQRDGTMRLSAALNGDGGPVYFPNSFNGPRIDREAVTELVPIGGAYSVTRRDGAPPGAAPPDNFVQPRQYLETDIGAAERGRIAARIANALAEITSVEVRDRVLTNCIAPLGLEFSGLVLASLRTMLPNVSPQANATPVSDTADSATTVNT